MTGFTGSCNLHEYIVLNTFVKIKKIHTRKKKQKRILLYLTS